MVELARFTGAPPVRAGELVAQIAAAVEGLTEARDWEGAGADGDVAAPLRPRGAADEFLSRSPAVSPDNVDLATQPACGSDRIQIGPSSS